MDQNQAQATLNMLRPYLREDVSAEDDSDNGIRFSFILPGSPPMNITLDATGATPEAFLDLATRLPRQDGITAVSVLGVLLHQLSD